MSDLANPELLTRQPGLPSSGGDGGGAAPIDTPQRDANSPEQAVEEMRAQLDAANRAREQAEAREHAAAREAAEARTRATTADTNAWTAQEQALDTAFKAQNTAIEQAKIAIANAQAVGDSMAVADAFDQLATARANLMDLTGRKAYLESQKARRQAEPQQPQGNVRTGGATVRTPGGVMDNVPPAAKQWMDEHPRFYDDPSYYNHAVAAHSTVTADGIQEGSPAYFRALSEAMQRFERFEAYERGDHQQQTSNNGHQQMQTPQRQQPRASSMGAPVSRTSTPVSRDGTPDPVSIARNIGANVTVDDLREFARVNGYGRDEAGFQRYLKDQQEVFDIARAGGDTGLRVDGVYR